MAAPKLKKTQPFQPSGEIARVVSLGGGTWAYVYDHLGKTHHVKRNSERMVTVCREADAVLGGQIRSALETLGWQDTIQMIYAEEKVAENTDAS